MLLKELTLRDQGDFSTQASATLGLNDSEEFARLTSIAASMDLIFLPLPPINLTIHGQAFVAATHWRLWTVPVVLEGHFEELGIGALFLGADSWEKRVGVVDLFGGAGGFSLAFESAGFAVKATVDNDSKACRAFARNFPNCKVISEDVNKIANESRAALDASFGLDLGGIAGVIGSPPCQGFSNIGEKLRNDPRNEMAHRFFDLVLGIQPLFFVFENVPALLSFGARPNFDTFLVRLNRATGEWALAIINALPNPADSMVKRSLQARKRLVSQSIQETRGVIDAFLGTVEGFGDLNETSAIATQAFSRAMLSALPQVFGDGLLPAARCSLSASNTAFAAIAISLSAETLIRRGIVNGKDCFSLVEDIACRKEGNLLLSTAAKGIIKEYSSLAELEEYRGVSIGPTLSRLIVQASEKYDVNKPVILNSADYGAPQKRQRLFLIGVRKDYFKTKDCASHQREFWDSWLKCLNRNLATASTAGDALGDLPNVDDYQELRDSDVLRTDQLARIPCELAAKLRLDESDHSDKSLPRSDWSPYWLNGCKRTVHSESVIKRLKTVREGKTDKTSRRTRLHRNYPSHTLRAGTLQDKGSHTAVRPIHYEHDRVITVREGARLMGYPDWMTFHGTNWHGSRLVGNGVPIKLGYAIAASLRDSLYPQELEE